MQITFGEVIETWNKVVVKMENRAKEEKQFSVATVCMYRAKGIMVS